MGRDRPTRFVPPHAQMAIQASAPHQAPDLRGWDHVDNMSAFMGIYLVLLISPSTLLCDARPCHHLARAS
jgi:hypothetical protein